MEFLLALPAEIALGKAPESPPVAFIVAQQARGPRWRAHLYYAFITLFGWCGGA